MLVLASGRQTGRTTKLVNLAALDYEAGNTTYIICHTSNEATRVFHEARGIGKNIGFPITYDELLNGKFFGKHIDGFYIDNAEFLLQRLCSIVPIKAIAITTSA